MYKRFKNIVIEDPDEPPTDDEIRAIEWALGAKLPYDFLNFLDAANGGFVPYHYVSVDLPQAKPKGLVFGRVLSTQVSSYVSFLSELRHHHDSPHIDGKVLPFTESRTGTVFFLDFRVSKQPSVLVSIPGWTIPQKNDALVTVADHFSEFLLLFQINTEQLKKNLLRAIEIRDRQQITELINYLELALPNWPEIFGIDYDDGRPKQHKLWD